MKRNLFETKIVGLLAAGLLMTILNVQPVRAAQRVVLGEEFTSVF